MTPSSPRIGSNKGRVVKYQLLPNGYVCAFSTNGKVYIEVEKGSWVYSKYKEISKEDLVAELI